MEILSSGLQVNTFGMKEGKGILISLQNPHLHPFCHMLANSVEKTRWILELEIDEGTNTPRSLEQLIKLDLFVVGPAR